MRLLSFPRASSTFHRRTAPAKVSSPFPSFPHASLAFSSQLSAAPFAPEGNSLFAGLHPPSPSLSLRDRSGTPSRGGLAQGSVAVAPLGGKEATRVMEGKHLLSIHPRTTPATMVNASTTQLASGLNSLHLRGKDNTPPASIYEGLKVQPLVPSGALNETDYP